MWFDQTTIDSVVKLGVMFGAIVGPVVTWLLSRNVKEYKLEINSRMTEMIDLKIKLAKLEGMVEQRERADALIAQRALALVEASAVAIPPLAVVVPPPAVVG